jgi:hypothetical protein
MMGGNDNWMICGECDVPEDTFDKINERAASAIFREGKSIECSITGFPYLSRHIFASYL